VSPDDEFLGIKQGRSAAAGAPVGGGAAEAPTALPALGNEAADAGENIAIVGRNETRTKIATARIRAAAGKGATVGVVAR
jgi:hypothetical protein